MRHPTARILWLVLLASQVIYVAVPFIAMPVGRPADSAFVWRMLLALAAISALTAAGTVIYRRRELVGPIQSGRLDPNSAEGFARLFTPFLVNLVFTESISIYGLVLAFLSHQPRFAFPFALGAFVLMYIHRPSAPDLAPPSVPPAYRPPPLA